jgi:hypothetical protein
MLELASMDIHASTVKSHMFQELDYTGELTVSLVRPTLTHKGY